MPNLAMGDGQLSIVLSSTESDGGAGGTTGKREGGRPRRAGVGGEGRGLAAARAARVNPSFFARGRSSGDPIYPP
uniref:Uncharacterized protein n=1 Tax=Oryza sativa subsp. japonica TaxID=39947 RepID=Q6Z7B8_ORYSJ|nr:hypothetical protein [Oryza sativa Japonica Group]BAD07930.1 hypothetical protein [Oryza sativa Japonica Group]